MTTYDEALTKAVIFEVMSRMEHTSPLALAVAKEALMRSLHTLGRDYINVLKQEYQEIEVFLDPDLLYVPMSSCLQNSVLLN